MSYKLILTNGNKIS